MLTLRLYEKQNVSNMRHIDPTTCSLIDDAITICSLIDDAVTTCSFIDDAITTCSLTDDAITTCSLIDDAISLLHVQQLIIQSYSLERQQAVAEQWASWLV